MNLFTSHWKKPRPVFLFQYPHFFVYFWRGVGFCFVSLFLLLFFVLGGWFVLVGLGFLGLGFGFFCLVGLFLFLFWGGFFVVLFFVGFFVCMYFCLCF